MLLLALCLCFTAQAATTDSLRQAIPTLQGEEKANAIVDLYLAYYQAEEIDSAMLWLNELIALRHKQGDTEREGAARWSRVAVLNNSARFEQLEQEAVEQMEWFRSHGIWDRFYQVWQRKCSSFYDRGKVQTSLREAQQMQDDAQRRNNNTGRAMAYKQMGIIYFDMQLFAQAAEAFHHGLELMEEEDDVTGMLSGLYDFYCKTLDKQKRYNEELQTTAPWMDYLDKVAQKHSEKMVNGPRSSVYLTRTAALIGLGRFDEAADALSQAEHYNTLYSTALSQFYVFYLKARLAMAQDDAATALAFTDSIEAMGMGEHFEDNAGLLRADALMQMERPKEAVLLYRKMYAEKDSLFSKDMRMQLDELNTLFKVDELKHEKERTQMMGYIIIASLMVVALLLILFFRYRASRRLRIAHALLEQSNEELKVARARAEESSRMKTNFIQQISHEIRTPLNVLSGFTQVITTPGMQLDDATKQDINQRITENTNRITGLINKMLELSDASSKAVIECKDDVPAVQVATQAVDESGIAQAAHIAFDLQLGEHAESLMLHTNLASATRALALLLDNAQKFTKTGHVLLKVGTQEEPHSVTFTVEDTGIGVPKEEADHIFEEFVQLDEYYDGTGIGLTVARSMARRMGGNIVLDTSYTHGARFIYSLPL